MILEDETTEAVKALLVALGEDVERDGLRDTPARVARAWGELLSGRVLNADAVLGTKFECDGYDEVIVLRDVSFNSVCEHHLMLFSGLASVAYLPKDGRVVGLSKLARLVDMHAKRLQLQERMTRDIAADIDRVLSPRGVAVIVEAQHLCMCARGVGKPGATMVTSVMLGAFRESDGSRAEVLRLIGGR